MTREKPVVHDEDERYSITRFTEEENCFAALDDNQRDVPFIVAKEGFVQMTPWIGGWPALVCISAKRLYVEKTASGRKGVYLEYVCQPEGEVPRDAKAFLSFLDEELDVTEVEKWVEKINLVWK